MRQVTTCTNTLHWPINAQQIFSRWDKLEISDTELHHVKLSLYCRTPGLIRGILKKLLDQICWERGKKTHEIEEGESLVVSDETFISIWCIKVLIYRIVAASTSYFSVCFHTVFVAVHPSIPKTCVTYSWYLMFYRDSKRSLLEEGNIMASLNHERVVKLLGVIMEDRDCSLVMELIPRGNLLVMLENVCTLQLDWLLKLILSLQNPDIKGYSKIKLQWNKVNSSSKDTLHNTLIGVSICIRSTVPHLSFCRCRFHCLSRDESLQRC